MSCVREGSLEPPYRPPHTDTHSHGEGRTGRFLRGLRRMFKRRGSGARTSSPDHKSSSTSELLEAEKRDRRKESVYGSGLSVSHDSVFTGERSGDESSDDRQTSTPAHGLAHLATSHRAELVAAVRRRGRGDASDDDEDLGLPRSPPASPPTDKADKRHHAGISHSSCSDGSLLSVGSSEMDEDSSSGHHHHDSSHGEHSDIYNSSEPPSGVAPLSHSAAKHKMAVRPRRTHGAPRRKKTSPIAATALPITPELNEEMIRSTTPDIAHKHSEVVTESFSSSTTTKNVIKEQHQQLNRELQKVIEPADTKAKSSSLPPGLALSQLVGQSPTKLTIAEEKTPRSSIKRSKSSSQGQPLRESPPKTSASTSETQINSYRSEEHVSKYKYTEETCHEKKSKSDKKNENEVIKSKKEESFFSRLLLRKSGKKKKDQVDAEGPPEPKKRTEKSHYTSVEAEKNSYNFRETGQGPKPVPSERTHKSAGQKVFANQMHKRIDSKGVYVQEGVYKDVYSAAKVSGIEYNITDLKVADETDKLLNLEMRRYSRRDDFNERVQKRTSSKENVDEKRESFSLHQEKAKRPTSMQRLDPYSTKSFITNEKASQEVSVPKLISNEEYRNSCSFHSGSMPKNIPYFNPGIVISASASPPKSVMRRSSENVKHLHRSSETVSETREKPIECKREKAYNPKKTEESYVKSERSLGNEYPESRGSIGKSHSFRYASETASITSHDSQMPSLPAIVGISEPLLESWEVNYRRNVDRYDASKRVSARNYNIVPAEAEANYDSLPSTDSSYLDSLKNDVNEDRKLFTNSVHITLNTHKRDSDISQIEAKIDDIISSPKPILAPILKSSSLDSVKSSPEKPMDDRRKTISIESALSGKVGTLMQKERDSETYISVTHINRDQTPSKSNEAPKLNRSDEKIQKSSSRPGVPEFLQIQLNKVIEKPVTNVVLTANVTPKKSDNHQADMDQDIKYEAQVTKTADTVILEPLIAKIKDNVDIIQNNDKASPVITRRSFNQNKTPSIPSTPKTFFKRKTTSMEQPDKPEKQRTNSISTDGSTEKIFDNISMDQKSHSSFGSKSSIQSNDSNEIKTPDRNEESVVYRKKPSALSRDFRSDKKNDDEPELMKVFARRSLKLKDCEAEALAQEIAESNNMKHEDGDNNATRSKILKNEFNASIKSRDSDKENDDTSSREAGENRIVDIAARVSQFGVPHYQRSVSITSVANPKRESAPAFKSDVSKYKKEVSDSTPEKRLRNRTFPDSSNDREDMKTIAKSEAYKDTLNKRPWLRKDDEKSQSVDKEKKDSAVIEKESDNNKEKGEKEKGADGEADGSPQFKGILQMRAEWERRAKQGMTK